MTFCVAHLLPQIVTTPLQETPNIPVPENPVIVEDQEVHPHDQDTIVSSSESVGTYQSGQSWNSDMGDPFMGIATSWRAILRGAIKSICFTLLTQTLGVMIQEFVLSRKMNRRKTEKGR